MMKMAAMIRFDKFSRFSWFSRFSRFGSLKRLPSYLYLRIVNRQQKENSFFYSTPFIPRSLRLITSISAFQILFLTLFEKLWRKIWMRIWTFPQIQRYRPLSLPKAHSQSQPQSSGSACHMLAPQGTLPWISAVPRLGPEICQNLHLEYLPKVAHEQSKSPNISTCRTLAIRALFEVRRSSP